MCGESKELSIGVQWVTRYSQDLFVQVTLWRFREHYLSAAVLGKNQRYESGMVVRSCKRCH